MGNQHSKIPQSILECQDPITGNIDPFLYELFKRQNRIQESNEELCRIIDNCHTLANEESNKIDTHRNNNQRNKRTRYEKNKYRCAIDGSLKPFGPKNTAWYNDYVDSPNVTCRKFQRKFRKRFRMSYPTFLKHLNEVKDHHLFKSWSETSKSCIGDPPSPIELLLLGTLRYLGRGWTLDDLEEQTNIAEETHRRFLHTYITWGATELFERYVTLPTKTEDIIESSSEYAKAGLPGCVGSQDATHVGMLRCKYLLKQYHDSFKLSMPSRTYNLTVNHRRRILNTTFGHPGRWNDKSIQLYDKLSMDLFSGNLYSDLSFTLYYEADGEVKCSNHKGAWMLVDNGYLSWPTMIPPLKGYTSMAEFRFSKWIESLRKDVECTFGILKGRFRILKTGIPLHGIEATDKIWLTCCALHNFLLEEDGLDGPWGANQYMSGMGEHELSDVRHFVGENASATYDTSGIGPGTDYYYASSGPDTDQMAEVAHDMSSNHIRHLTREQFRNKLIKHFDVQWKKKNIVWPSRDGLGSIPIIE
jgi:hypothetical protein